MRKQKQQNEFPQLEDIRNLPFAYIREQIDALMNSFAQIVKNHNVPNGWRNAAAVAKVRLIELDTEFHKSLLEEADRE